jgi:hypothetical protein
MVSGAWLDSKIVWLFFAARGRVLYCTIILVRRVKELGT